MNPRDSMLSVLVGLTEPPAAKRVPRLCALAMASWGMLIAHACPIGDPCGKPVAQAIAMPTEGPAPLVVVFRGDGVILGGLGSVESLSWVFGNGLGSTKPNETVTYETAGDYRAYLAATGCGLQDTAFVRIRVR